MIWKKETYFSFFLFLLGVLVFFLLRTYITGIVSAFVIALFTLPLFRYLSKKMPGRLAAILIILPVVLLLAFISYFISSEVASQAEEYISENSIKSTFQIFVENIPGLDNFAHLVDPLSSRIREILIGLSLSFISNIPTIAINVLLSFFIAYYLLVNWKDVSSFIDKAVPIKRRKTKENIKNSFYKIFYGLSIVAIIEFVVSALGFWLAGVKFYLFLALLIAIAAFIPFFGPIAIWLPVSIYYLALGDVYAFVIVLVTGLTLTVIIENMFSHVMVGKASKINPVFMILGTFGGIAMFGIFGFVIGPLLLIAFIEMYKGYLEDINSNDQI